jgi:hypothetical protein
MLVLSLVGVLAISAVPALSQPVDFFPDDGSFVVFDPFDEQSAPVSQEFSESRITSGAASPSVDISNSGNNVNLCAPVQQVVNTGNVANEQGVVQYHTDTDDISFEGSSITIEPSLSSDCTQSIDQATAV